MSQAEKVNLYSKIGETTENEDDDGRLNFSSVRLIELPPSLLEIIESSNPPSLTIKPSPNGTAILNTPTKSFLLRAVDQSNSLMLFTPSETEGFQLVHTAKQYLEVVSNPNRVRMDNLLPVWDGETMDIDGRQKITMNELRRGLAASDLEIDNALDGAYAVEIDGYVYRMSAGYTTHLLDLIITAAAADSLSLDSLTLNQINTSISSDEERPECIEAILKSFSETASEPYSLSRKKIIQWYGLRTLSSLNGCIPTLTFAQKWQSSLPTLLDGTHKDLQLLIGNYHHPTPSTIQYLPAHELSHIPEQRFAQLFGIKEKWEVNEIMPFLEGCVESGNGWEKKAERECQKWARVRGGMVMKR